MLTRSGRTLAGTCLVLLVAAVVTAYPQAAALAMVGVAALASGALLTRRPRVELSCAWERSRATEGDPVVLAVHVANPTRRREAPLLAVPEILTAASTPCLAVPALAAGSDRTASLTVSGLGRGRHAVTALRAERFDPLALMRRQVSGRADAGLLVHPRTASLVVPGRTSGSADEGPTTDAGLRGGGVFHSLREYRPGDDHRLIHWPSTARTGTVMVRDVVVPDVQQHLVVLVTDAELYADGQFDEAVRIAASIVLSASRRHHTWLITTSGESAACPPGDRDAQVAMLDRLACLAPGSRTGDRVHRDLQGVVATVVTGDVDKRPERRHLTLVAGAAAVHLVQIVPGQGGHGRSTSGVSIRTGGLTDFASRWNASWRG